MFLKLLVVVLLLIPQFGFAYTAIDVGAGEDGHKTTGQQEIWHDVENNHNLNQVLQAYQAGEFKPLSSAGSTGLEPGAFWSHFALHNTTDQPLALDLEYVDHQ